VGRRRSATATPVTVTAVPVSKDELAKLPKTLQGLVRAKRSLKDPLTHFIRRIAGGMETVYWLLKRSTHDPIAVRIVKELDFLKAEPKIQEFRKVDVDRILELTELDARDMVSCIVRCGWDINIELGKAIFAMNYPNMMHASMKRATQTSGTEERKMHFQASGHLPVSKGVQIGIKNINTAAASEEDRSPGHVPSFRQTARSVVRELPAAKE